jgi:hypothetical protein
MALLCTREELDGMCRNGAELVHEAIDSGAPGGAGGVRADLRGAGRARRADGRLDLDRDPLDPGDPWARFGALLDAGDAAGAKRFYAEVDAACLALHDYRIDWLSAVLNQVYRRHGAEGLAAAQLACANEDWWHDRMVGDSDCRGVPGRCWFTIYKDPHDTPAADYERAGLEKPARA